MASSLDRRARKLVDRIRKDHRDFEAIEALAAHYAKAGDQASLANLLQGFADSLEEPRAAADAYVRAADAALFLNDQVRAALLYERALAREPSHSEALDRALRVAESTHDFEAMRRILTSVVRAIEGRGGDRKPLAALHFRLGQLLETRFQDDERALALYRLAIEDNPQFVKAIVSLRRLYERAANPEAVSATYEMEVAAAKLPEDQRTLLVTLAEHERDQCHDLDRAIAALRRACRLAPPDLPTLRRLAELLIERSEQSDSEADLKRAAEVYFQAARSVARADAPPLLLRALALAPEHARAQALLQELHHHAAVGGEQPLPFGGVPQRLIDAQATRQMASPPAAAPVDQTTALGTADLLAVQDQLQSGGTIALSTAELIPLRPNVPLAPLSPAHPPPSAAEPNAPASDSPDPPPLAAAPSAPAAASNQTMALSIEELTPLRVTPPPHPASAVPNAAATPPPTPAPIRTPLDSSAPDVPALVEPAVSAQVPIAARRPLDPPLPVVELDAQPAPPLTAAEQLDVESPTSAVPEFGSDDLPTSAPIESPPTAADHPRAAVAFNPPHEPATADTPAMVPAEPPSTAAGRPRAPAAFSTPDDPGATIAPVNLRADRPPTAAAHSNPPIATGPVPDAWPTQPAVGARVSSPPMASAAPNVSTPTKAAPETASADRPLNLQASPPPTAAARPHPPSEIDRPHVPASIAAGAAPEATSAHPPVPEIQPLLEPTPVAISPSVRSWRPPDAAPTTIGSDTPQQAPAIAPSPWRRPRLRPELTITPSTPEHQPKRPAPESTPPLTDPLPRAYETGPNRPTRARILPALERDPTCLTIEVNLGATTESNLYVDMGDRIADGGVFVATYQALPADTPIELHITLPGGLQTFAHGLATLRRDSLDAFEDPVPGICVAFEALSQDGLELLQRFAAKRTPLLIDDR